MTVATHPLYVAWLGQVALCLDGVRLEPGKPSRKADVLLAYLALNAGLTHERSKLIDYFCANVKDPAGDLRGILKRAREMAGPEATEPFYAIPKANGESAVRFVPTDRLRIDVIEFRKPFGHAPSLQDLINKAALYGGPFMPGYEGMDSVRWVEQTRAGLDGQFGDLMKRLLDELFAAERWADLVQWAEYWIARSDLPRDAYSDMLAAYSELGDLPKLDTTYKRYAHALSDMGVGPSEDLQRQYDFYRKALVERYSKPNLNGRNGRPTPTAAPSTAAQPKPLPQPPTSFISRANDLLKITETLSNAECQLVTLVGIGGVGKTRLALHAAQALQDRFADGVAFVNLGQISNDEQFATVLADALGFVPYGQEPLLAQVQNYLRQKHVLIVFDAFEHVIPDWAAMTNGTRLLDELLDAAPGCKALVTSRQRLQVQREYALPIEGLSYPEGMTADELSDEAIERYDAVKLFLRTARRVRGDFSLRDEKAGVVRICQHTRGLPLAIDLAAVQVVGLSAAQIADAIEANLDALVADDPLLDDRHHSLRATFEYTWQMLAEDERRAFAQLSAFAGSFGREAALTVTQAPQRVLNTLVGNTLLRYDYKAARYDLHDLLRQFGAEKLQHTAHEDWADLMRCMAEYYLSFARRNQKRYDALGEEWGNFLAAMRAMHQRASWQMVLDFAEVLGEVWFTRARFTDARLGYELACDAARQATNRPTLAHFLNRWARACIEQGDYAQAISKLEESAQVAGPLHDPRVQADAQYLQGWVAFEQGELEQAHTLLTACKQTYDALADARGAAEALHGLARIAFSKKQYPEAIRQDEAALAILATGGDQEIVCQILCYLAIACCYVEDFDAAQAYCQRELELSQQIQDLGEYAAAKITLSEVCLRTGDLEMARQHALYSLQWYKEIGDRKSLAHATFHLCSVDKARKDYARALDEAIQSTALYETLGDTWSMVRPLLFAGDILASLEEHEQAIQAWQEGLTLATEIKHPLAAMLRERLDGL